MARCVRFLPPNPLAGKARPLPGKSAEELCLKATQAVEGAKAPLFVEFVKEAEQLKSVCDALSERPGDPSGQIKALNAIAFELKGLGGMFGYPLVSRIGELILQVTKPDIPVTEDVLEVIELQVDALTLVIRERREGDGGERGRDLVASLEAAMDKVLARG